MLRIIASALPYICALLASVACAEGNATGLISGGWLDREASDSGYLFSDYTAAFGSARWRAALGVFGVVGRLHETYAEVLYDRGDQQISLGFPRPAYDRFAGSALTRIMPRLSLESVGVSGSRATYGTMVQSDYLPYGAVVAGSGYALSLHGVPDYGTTILGAGLSREYGRFRYALAAEAVDQDGAVDWNGKAQLAFDAGQAELAVAGFQGAANGQPDAVELSATGSVTDWITLSGMLRQPDDGAATRAFGLQFDVDDKLAIETGVALIGSEETVLSAALTVRF